MKTLFSPLWSRARQSKTPPPPLLPLYRPLGGGEIRTCHVRPGRWTDPIVCSLSSCQLDDTRYKCLSYVWGNANDAAVILLNGQHFPVTRNLFIALRRLRGNGETQALWIDAICINQIDTAEKTLQVSRMAQIYTKTDEVLIWLGEETQLGDYRGLVFSGELPSMGPIMNVHSPPTIDTNIQRNVESAGELFLAPHKSANGIDYASVANFMNTFAKNSHASQMFYFQACHGCQNRTGLHLHYNTQWMLALRSLKDFIGLPWFDRTWTVQEAILPREARVLYGSHTFPWTHFVAAARNYKDHRYGCCAGLWSNLPQDHVSILDEWCSRVMDMENVREHRKVDFQLVQLLLQFRSRKATDPRDKIYAFLGLQAGSNHQHVYMKPDYSLTTAEVYCALFVGLTKVWKTLYFLEVNNSRLMTELPSWAVDWTASTANAAMDQTRAMVCRLYKASRRDAMVTYDRGSAKLTLDGFLIDSVAATTGLFPEPKSIDDIAAALGQWETFVKPQNPEKDVYVAGGGLHDAFCRTLLADCVFDLDNSPRRATEKDCISCHNWLQAMRDPASGPLRVKPNDPTPKSVQVAVLHRKLFRTAHGYVGLGPPDTSPGDRVYVLNGGTSPFLLRRSVPTPGQPLTELMHQFVGVCYVHGVMDGEAETVGTEERVTLI